MVAVLCSMVLLFLGRRRHRRLYFLSCDDEEYRQLQQKLIWRTPCQMSDAISPPACSANVSSMSCVMSFGRSCLVHCLNTYDYHERSIECNQWCTCMHNSGPQAHTNPTTSFITTLTQAWQSHKTIDSQRSKWPPHGRPTPSTTTWTS